MSFCPDGIWSKCEKHSYLQFGKIFYYSLDHKQWYQMLSIPVREGKLLGEWDQATIIHISVYI